MDLQLQPGNKAAFPKFGEDMKKRGGGPGGSYTCKISLSQLGRAGTVLALCPEAGKARDWPPSRHVQEPRVTSDLKMTPCWRAPSQLQVRVPGCGQFWVGSQGCS